MVPSSAIRFWETIGQAGRLDRKHSKNFLDKTEKGESLEQPLY